MTREVSIVFLGLLVAVMPFLGFPQRFEEILLVIFGLLIAAFALSSFYSLDYFLKNSEQTSHEEQNAEQSEDESH